MLKWAVYGKKSQDVKIPKDIETEDRQSYTNGPYTRQMRRSLDGNTVKKSKKPMRYQRRSLGSAARKNLKSIDKENVNYIGNTPNYFKEAFISKKSENGFALKDVSNITPNSTPVKSKLERKYYLSESKEAIPPDLPPTPPTYSRKIREAKKRKLEMATNKPDSFVRDAPFTKSERRVNFHIEDEEQSVTPGLSHSKSEPSLNELSDQLEASKCSYRNALTLAKQTKSNLPISTTKALTQGLVEIEYDHNLVINCIEQPVVIPKESSKQKKTKPEKPSTIPIFGHHIFMENPLYFNKHDLESSQMRPLKRTRKKSSEFESSFKSPSVDRRDLHSLVRDACSPISVTPLTLKLSALRFSTMSTHTKSQRITEPADITDCFSKTDVPFSIALRDEEASTEMENKFILCRNSITNVTESTVSTTAMGDITLERMIEDIIKSTKKVKTKRRIKKVEPVHDRDSGFSKEDSLESPTDVFVNSQAENKVNLIREAKYVSLSRENSISPKNSPSKKIICNRRNNKMYKSLSNLPVGTVIFDDEFGYNEREVKTPDSFVQNEPKKLNKSNLERSQSMHYPTQTAKPNLDCVSSESTPDLFSSLHRNSNLGLRRQKCIRRKKSTLSNESSWRKHQTERQSILTLEDGIPSPYTEFHMSVCDPASSPLPPYMLDPINSSPNLNSSLILEEPYPERNKRSRELFGLTLESGIPSPITPVANLKRSSCNLSEGRAHKTSKLDEEIIKNTPVLEHKSSRRCLTFSPEEGSINSTEEKRRSVASNRFDRSCERYQLKGTIDLEVFTRNKIIDVHVIRCRDLQRSCGRTDDINAYAKVVISGVNESQSLASQRSIFQRTSVLYGKREPEFQRHLRLPLPNTLYDQQMLHVSVWHRDKIYRRSEFLGCVSFPIKDAIKSDISGTYFLQSQVSGRTQSTHASTTAPGQDPKDRCPREVSDEVRVTVNEEGRRKMATDNIDASTNEEAKDNHIDKGLSSNGPTTSAVGSAQSVAAAFQKEADDHLFLRYLELDPPEDPAAPKKSQRHGRTPFTTTRKLSRGTSGGFGFTLVWTRPPRVERVAAGGSAERAGLRAGDYIVFVGSKNVVTANEEDVRNLIKASGQMLQLETFRRIPNNGIGTRPRVSQVEWQIPSETASPPAHISTPIPAPRSPRAAPPSPVPAARPPTACSSTSQSLDRRKLHLPQVTFSKEVLYRSEPGWGKDPTPPHHGYAYVNRLRRFESSATVSLNTDGRKRALLAVVSREQHYTTCLQFGVVRFVSPLAERADLIQPSDHQLLFQNIEEILRLSEDILDQIVQEDGEIQTSTVVAVYHQKTPILLSLYRKYCLGLKRADCVLVKKSKDPSGAFARFCTSPPIPRRRPDITSLVHKPLEQFRELLRLMRAAAASKGSGPYEHLEKKQLQIIAEQLRNGYQDVTAGSGLMGLAGDGKPLLSVSDLESRLVFTRCKPFVLSTGGRQWIFGGELSRIEGRSVRPYWALLFTDLLLFATVSRDRVLFVTEEPVSLGTVSEAQFNVRKKATEFRLILGRTGGESPLVSCAPRTPSRARTVVLRAPSMDLKAVWQSLLQRQIYRAHTMTGTPLGSPLDSPDPHLSFSLATLDSQQRQTRRSSAEASGTGAGGSTGIDGAARSQRSRGSSVHLQRWMTQLTEADEFERPELDLETWSVEELRKRSKELNLLEVAAVNNNINNNDGKVFSPVDKKENERSPSKSSNSGSQITVRTSPVVVDTIPICRQCHQKCLSKPNSPLISQKEAPKSKPKPFDVSPQTSNKSSNSTCSANCGNRKPKNFNVCHLERKGAIKILRPEDAPKAALKVIDSIEQSQKMLKSTSYELKTDSPILSRSVCSNRSKSPNKSQLELKREFCNSGRSPSPCSSSRNNSPLSTSHTTCSSMVFNSSSNDIRMSNSNINQIQCVIAQEKYLNEVKCVENITVSKNRFHNLTNQSPGTVRKEQKTRQKAENVLNKVLGMNIITKRENIGPCLNTSSVFLEDNVAHEEENEIKFERGLRRSPRMGISAVTKMNGDIKTDPNANSNKGSDAASDDDLELGPLMLMGLSAINPAAHLLRVEPFRRSGTTNGIPGSNSDSSVPNIAVVPPTPDYIINNKTDDLLDDSPDSPLPEEPPYISLKRYGTMSSLERFPSDETDDGNIRLTAPDSDGPKNYNPGGTSGIMGWTARAGSFVVEKMNIFSYTESVPNTNVLMEQKQPSFLERCLGVSDWKGSMNPEEGTGEPGEGSGASGEEAWGTPSSGDLSDNLQDSEHGTLSSPTKSSSSYAGDDDTELMMDELLMAPTITGPTTLRPLLPRRRLEPLLEEDCSDSSSDDNKPTPTNPESQDSARGPFADVCCAAPCRLLSASDSGAGGEGAGGAQCRGEALAGGDVCALSHSPDRTPTNELPSLPLQSVSREYTEGRSGAVAAAGVYARRGSASTASTPSTLDRTAIHNPPTPPHQDPGGADQAQDSFPISEEELKIDLVPAPVTPPEERLSPRAEMRLALDQGRDILAEQEAPWAGVSDPWLWRAACQRSLLRRVASADTVTVCRPPTHLAARTAPHTTSRNSVYAWKAPENEKLMEMEQLARVEVQTMRSRTRSQCQNGKILGFLRRRASSDSPRRELTSFGAPRPFSPRRSTVSNNGYYKICFVNGYVIFGDYPSFSYSISISIKSNVSKARTKPHKSNTSAAFSASTHTEKQDKRFWKQVSRRRQSCGSVNQD